VREDGVPHLLDDNASRGEGCLLRVVAREDEPLGGVRDAVRGDGWVVGDLLDGQRRLPATVLVWPGTEEELAEDRVERLLFRAHLLVSRRVLSLECSLQRVYCQQMTSQAKGSGKTYDEPFEDAEGAIFLVDTVVDVCEQLWSFQPVRCEFCGVSGGK
jgi:hypothetical protein